MGESGTCAANLELIGGRLCLDFANTVDWHASDHPREWLTDYRDLVEWSQHAGILRSDEAAELLGAAAARPEDAARALAGAIVLREAVYRTFSAVAARRPVNPGDLQILNEAVGRASARASIVAAAEGFEWAWAGGCELDRMLWPIARSAADLLTSPDLRRVRECPGDGCGWLFVDASKNRTRKWCSMDSCGNRAKARRHYRRTRGREGAADS